MKNMNIKQHVWGKKALALGGFLLAFTFFSFMLPGGWTSFSSGTGKFKVQFPRAPHTGAQDAQTTYGKVTMNLFTCDNYTDSAENVFYNVMFSDYPKTSDVNSDGKPEKIKEFLDGMMTNSVSLVKGKILASKDIKIGKFPGREFSAEVQNGKNNTILRCRCYIVKHRIYLLQALAKRPDVKNPDAEKFFNSFALTK